MFEKRLKFRRCSGLVTGDAGAQNGASDSTDQEKLVIQQYLYYLILSYVKCWEPFDVKGDSFFYRRGQWQLGTGGNRLPVAMIRHNFHHESYRKDKIYDDKKLPLFILHKLPNNASKISNSQSF